MTRDAFAHSTDGSVPVFLYAFSQGATTVRFTTAVDVGDTFDHGGNQFTGEAISHSQIRSSGRPEKEEIEFRFPIANTFAQAARLTTGQSVSFTIWDLERDDPDAEARVIRKGSIGAGRTVGKHITLTGLVLSTNLALGGQSVVADTLCNWRLYQPDTCRLDIADFQVAGTVTAISGLTLTIAEAAAAPDGDYTNGILEYGGELRPIERQVGDQVTLLEALPALTAAFGVSGSEPVLIAPGCDKTEPRCLGRFNNLVNAMMWPRIATGDVFGGGAAVY